MTLSSTSTRQCDRCGRPIYRKHWFSVLRGYCITRLMGIDCSWMKETS